MEHLDTGYYALLCVMGGTALIFARRKSAFRAVVAGAFAIVGLGALLGLPLSGDNVFALLRMLSYVGFILVPAYFVLAAVLFRRQKRLAMLLTLGAVAIVGVGIDAFFVEPQWLEITNHRLAVRGLPQPVRIVSIADLQTDHFGRYEEGVLRNRGGQRHARDRPR